MLSKDAIGALAELGAESLGVFRARAAVEAKVTRKQLAALRAAGVIVRELPDVYRMTVVTRSAEQRLRAALLWAGHAAAGAGLSAGEHYALEGVRARAPEIVVPVANNMRSKPVVVHRTNDRAALMVRMHSGLPITGVEATLVALAHALDGEALEIACEDARRRGLTGVPQLRAYLAKFGSQRTPGTRGDTRAARRARSATPLAIDARGQDPPAPRRARDHRLPARAPARVERSPVPLRLRVRVDPHHSQRRTGGDGTTIRATSSTTTRSGAFPATMAIGSCSRRGTTSRSTPIGSSPTSLPPAVPDGS